MSNKRISRRELEERLKRVIEESGYSVVLDDGNALTLHATQDAYTLVIRPGPIK